MADILVTALTAALAAMGAAAPPSDSPIRLVVERIDDGVRLKVIGASATAVKARYALEVSSGGNRSQQRGNAVLRPAVPVTLVTLSLGHVTGTSGEARLHVVPETGAPYDEVVSLGADAAAMAEESADSQGLQSRESE